MKTEDIFISTDDGFQLAATEYQAEKGNGIGLVLNGATGVLRKYYHLYAEFLCQQGFIPAKMNTHSGTPIPAEGEHLQALKYWARYYYPKCSSSVNNPRIFLIDSPFRFSLCALCKSRSKMASAKVASPMYLCQLMIGN